MSRGETPAVLSANSRPRLPNDLKKMKGGYS